MWQGQLDALSDSYRLIAWDMRGHDRSDSPEDPALYSHEVTIADMAAVLDACGVRRAVIGGLSLGGFMSLAFHLAHPARTLALMLFDTGPGYKKDERRNGWNRMAESMAAAYEKHGLSRGRCRRGGHPRSSPQREGPRARGARDARAERRPRDRVVANISVPTLVLVGANDQQFLPSAEYMAAKIPRAEKVILERRRPRREYRSARGVQHRGPFVSRARDA